jgi:hypothetical protein
MIRRLAVFAAAVAAVAAACRPIPAPANGVVALSEVKLAAPGVVVGDTMRDSNGVATALSVVAYGAGGESDTVSGVPTTFIVLDRGAHVSPDNYLIGDSARSTPVRVIGSVGVLQTSAANVNVTLHPDSLSTTVVSPTDTVKFTPLDSTDTANYSVPLTGIVIDTAAVPDTGVASVIVRYAIVYQPAASDGAVSALLVDDAGRASSVDTSDATGHVARRVLVRTKAPWLPDSVVVTMSASYAGARLAGSPIRFVVPTHSPADTTTH